MRIMARPKRDKLTAQQMECIQLLIMKDINKMNNKDIAEHLGINETTLYRWYQNDMFIDELNKATEQMQRAYLNETYLQLRKVMRNGNDTSKLKAIELFLKNQGKLKEQQETKVEVKVTTVDDLAKKYNVDIDLDSEEE